MASNSESHLSRRQRQIMDIVYARGRASVADVCQEMPDAPSYSAVRTLMGILEDKGHLTHESVGGRYVYMPTRSRKAASRSALQRVLTTFFDGSTEQALAALLEDRQDGPDRDELIRMAELIEQARKDGR